MPPGSPPGRAGAALLVYMCNRWYRARQVAITVVFWPGGPWAPITLGALQIVKQSQNNRSNNR